MKLTGGTQCVEATFIPGGGGARAISAHGFPEFCVPGVRPDLAASFYVVSSHDFLVTALFDGEGTTLSYDE
jgi:hypothetical protein